MGSVKLVEVALVQWIPPVKLVMWQIARPVTHLRSVEHARMAIILTERIINANIAVMVLHLQLERLCQVNVLPVNQART